MSDYESLTTKAMHKDKLYSLLTNSDSLMSHKIRQDGINYYNLSFLTKNMASIELDSYTRKYGPAMAARVVKESPRSHSFLNKLETISQSIDKLVGNKGEAAYDFANNISQHSYYKDSVFASVIERALKAKSATKSCNKCGHRHYTKPNHFNISASGCNKCGYQFHFFTEADFKKHASALAKLKKLEDQELELKNKIKEFTDKQVKANNYTWFIGASTKAVAESLLGYED